MTLRSYRFPLIALAALLAAAPALAVVNTNGDVRPAASPFGVIFVDDDGDFFSDVISSSGNTLATGLVDPLDPTGGSGNGLAWDDPIVWRNYESQQNILVGETGAGSLVINGGSALRYQHVVLGGLSDDLGNNGYELTASGQNPTDFTLINAIGSANSLSSGFGVMTVTGFGSLFNNDPQVYDLENAAALFQAQNPGTPFDSDFDPTSPDPGARSTDAGDGYDFYVGLSGGGEFNVTDGGRAEIQDSLIVGLGNQANGTVNIDGAGSILTVFGRRDFTPGAFVSSFGSNVSGSIIGGNGVGQLNVTNGGTARFLNGLGLGDDSAGIVPGLVGIGGGGSGTAAVTGVGSTVNTYASAAMVSPTGGALALAVGELRNTSTDLNPSDEFGDGSLEIGAGALVRATFDTGYGQVVANANAEVGYNGTVTLAGGQLRVDNNLLNDGRIEGQGLVRANQLANTVFGVIDGDSALTPLSIRVDSSGNDFSSDHAAVNLGVIRGNVDITVNGGLSNGDDEVIGSNGGQIRATGSIRAGSFINHASAELAVSSGQSLSVLATAPDADVAGSFPILERDDMTGNSTDGDFFQANLGSISVEGGLLEVGRTVSSGADGLTDNQDRFRNARAYDDTSDIETARGTIVSNDGTLVFQSGLYNTSVLAFTGGDNLVRGEIFNSDDINYDPGDTNTTFDGIIVVSGDDTTVTFTDNVENNGEISIGPNENVVNFLGDLTGSGVFSTGFAGFALPSAAIVVSNDVSITGGEVVFNFLTEETPEVGFSFALITAGGELDEETRFDDLVLPDLPEGQFWDVVYDTELDQVRLEIVESMAIGADFNGDGVVNAADVDIWIANAGINSGASIIQGDVDFDGDVDLSDYEILMDQVFTGVPVAINNPGGNTPVPEPTALLLAAIASAGFIRRRS